LKRLQLGQKPADRHDSQRKEACEGVPLPDQLMVTLDLNKHYVELRGRFAVQNGELSPMTEDSKNRWDGAAAGGGMKWVK
jgi:hypothetical protein